MRAFEFLIEYGVKGTSFKHKKYRGGKLPDWYYPAVDMKEKNPEMSATEIGRKLGIHVKTVLRWLAGIPDSAGRIYNDNPPFNKSEHFPIGLGMKKYFDGAKPWWYEEAIKLRKQGMTYPAIANKLSTPEKRVASMTLQNWLVKGKTLINGKLINSDAPFTPRPYNTTKIDTALLKELIDDDYTDEQIIELIADEKGDKIAGQVRAMLPQLRKKLNPGTEVRNKVTGDDISGFVQENFSD
jgi:hypothetical protein